MKIAVIGSGGREHALLWKLSQTDETYNFFALPGNGGTSGIAQNISVDVTNNDLLVKEIKAISADFVVVGPEVPLANGLVNLLEKEKIACFGPVKEAAQIEASKAFAKEVMQSANIPTADFMVFEDYDNLNNFVKQSSETEWVVKADGLAAGKGVVVCSTKDEVLQAAYQMLNDNIFGDAGKKIVLEKKLYGIEASAHFMCDGETFIALPTAKDYKRVNDGDQGPNTGGMGTYSPAKHLTPELLALVEKTVVKPLLKELTHRGISYRGTLYVGLMLTDSGPKVIEFNCRLGDPETQVMLPIWNGNLLKAMIECSQGKLNPIENILHKSAVCVVLVAGGYPNHYDKNIPLKIVPDTKNSLTFHAGTAVINRQLLSMGGRVLNAVGLGDTISQARNNAYTLANKLMTKGLKFRSDIAAQL